MGDLTRNIIYFISGAKMGFQAENLNMCVLEEETAWALSEIIDCVQFTTYISMGKFKFCASLHPSHCSLFDVNLSGV